MQVMPVKDSHTHTRINITHLRIKPLALANGRYKTVAPERELVSVGKLPLHITVIRVINATVSIPTRQCNGRFTSETAGDGRGYRNICEMPQGPILNLIHCYTIMLIHLSLPPRWGSIRIPPSPIA
jgi:hypothetical protein